MRCACRGELNAAIRRDGEERLLRWTALSCASFEGSRQHYGSAASYDVRGSKFVDFFKFRTSQRSRVLREQAVSIRDTASVLYVERQ